MQLGLSSRDIPGNRLLRPSIQGARMIPKKEGVFANRTKTAPDHPNHLHLIRLFWGFHPLG